LRHAGISPILTAVLTAAGPVRLSDGSTATPIEPNAIVVVVEASETRATMRLTRGAARFEVAHRAGRTFRVEAGDVSILVLGTTFTVARSAGGARVTVEAGRVRVLWQGRYADLGAGDAGDFPRASGLVATEADTQSTAEDRDPEPRRSPDIASEPSHGGAIDHTNSITGRNWRALADRGQYEDAFRVLHRDGAHAMRDEPGDLLTASDVARLSGHPEDAVAPLTQLLNRHRADARAPLAAFTLGRVLLEELGRPREAAAAFRTAQSLQHSGSIAVDALAREVEADSRAGDAVAARAAAERYVAENPDGTAIRRVRRFGGLE